jgi:Holliday junction resolvase
MIIKDKINRTSSDPIKAIRMISAIRNPSSSVFVDVVASVTVTVVEVKAQWEHVLSVQRARISRGLPLAL